MAFDVIDPAEFLDNGIFFEDYFFEKTKEYDWGKFDRKKVLVRGCSTIIPPWAYMYITGKLTPKAKSIRFGNEHDNVVVYRSPSA